MRFFLRLYRGGNVKTGQRKNLRAIYLCSIDKYNSTDIDKLLQNEFNDMTRRKTKQKGEEQNKFDDIITVIHNTVYNDTAIVTANGDVIIK